MSFRIFVPHFLCLNTQIGNSGLHNGCESKYSILVPNLVTIDIFHHVKNLFFQCGLIKFFFFFLRKIDSLGQNPREGSLSLHQGIFPTQGSKPGLRHNKQILYQMSHKGSPRILERVAYLFSRGQSQLTNQTGVSCIADRFFTELSGKSL